MDCCLAWQKLQRRTLHANSSTNFFMPAMLICTTDFCHFFLPLSPTLALPGGSQCQHKAKHVGFICSQTFWQITVKFDTVLKQFKLNCYFFGRFSKTREMIAVLQTLWKKIDVGIHLDVYVPTWFKLGMMIDTVDSTYWYRSERF